MLSTCCINVVSRESELAVSRMYFLFIKNWQLKMQGFLSVPQRVFAINTLVKLWGHSHSLEENMPFPFRIVIRKSWKLNLLRSYYAVNFTHACRVQWILGMRKWCGNWTHGVPSLRHMAVSIQSMIGFQFFKLGNSTLKSVGMKKLSG